MDAQCTIELTKDEFLYLAAALITLEKKFKVPMMESVYQKLLIAEKTWKNQ